MAKLSEIAQRVWDLYEQNYPANDSFLDIDDFKFQITVTYSALINAMYQTEKRDNKREEGFSNIEVPAGWLKTETLKLISDDSNKTFYVTTSLPVFFFDWDGFANTIQDVFSVGPKNCEYRKISLNERKFLHLQPPSSVSFFALTEAKKIKFYNARGCSEVEVSYIPAIVGREDDCLLSDNIVPTIIDTTLERMFRAKNGNFIQKLDNQNPNIVPGQQVDPMAGMKQQ